MGTIRVRNEAQLILLVDEMFGQFSDGHWENSPGDPWREWVRNEVIVDPDNVGLNFHPRKRGWGLTNKDLLEVVGDRMVASVRDGREVWNQEALRYERPVPGVDPSYTWDKMVADLKDLKKIFKIDSKRG